MLTLDPSKRITAKEALNHPYFTELPEPTPIESLPSTPKPNSDKKEYKSEMKENERVQKRFGTHSLFSPIPRKQLKFTE